MKNILMGALVALSEPFYVGALASPKMQLAANI